HVCDQGGGLLGRRVRQAKNRQIDLGEQALLGGGVLARFNRQAAQRDAGERRKLFPYLQTGRSGLAVNENRRCHDRLGRGRKLCSAIGCGGARPLVALRSGRSASSV